jgi:hypothetical protein
MSRSRECADSIVAALREVRRELSKCRDTKQMLESLTAGERAEIIASAEDILKLNRQAIILRGGAAIVRRPPSTL